MRVTDLDLRELLDFAPHGGVIRFAGQRALIVDAVALGLLRRELITTFGAEVARGVLTRFGYSHGWRTAESMKAAFPWDDAREWRIAGGRLHALQGLVVFEPGSEAELADGDGHVPFATATWRQSYEAEQHLLLIGRAEAPVCWTLAGFASGYLSYSNGREIYCLEDRCMGCGDAACRMVGRTREQWGPEVAGAMLKYYEQECVDAALGRVTDALKRAERELASRRRALAARQVEHASAGAGGDEGDGDDDAALHGGMVARSEAMQRVLDLAERVAAVDATVLITGESGVGKERVARLLHERSARGGYGGHRTSPASGAAARAAPGPFVAVNCGAVTETLLESELFGHAKGAFTGAVSDRPGLFEAANGGTLFLDEIGEVSPALQVKLLRVLQEREVRRVGENKSRPVDVRVVAATNRHLAEEVAQGRFRQDLYYRLRVIELAIPPLRERKEDILPLARALLARTAERLGRKLTGLTPQAADQLVRYGWPGNVRELENAIERAVVLADGSKVDVADLPEEVRVARPPAPAGALEGAVRPLEDIEREYILAALKANGGNQARTAAQLKIGTATLYRKLKQYADAGAPPPPGGGRAP